MSALRARALIIFVMSALAPPACRSRSNEKRATSATGAT